MGRYAYEHTFEYFREHRARVSLWDVLNVLLMAAGAGPRAIEVPLAVEEIPLIDESPVSMEPGSAEGSMTPIEVGNRFDRIWKEAVRNSPTELGGGWERIPSAEVGGPGLPDEVIVNHADRRVIVIDYYAGTKADVITASGPESWAHFEKGWNYPNTNRYIDDLVRNQGYRYEYYVAGAPGGVAPH